MQQQFGQQAINRKLAPRAQPTCWPPGHAIAYMHMEAISWQLPGHEVESSGEGLQLQYWFQPGRLLQQSLVVAGLNAIGFLSPGRVLALLVVICIYRH